MSQQRSLKASSSAIAPSSSQIGAAFALAKEEFPLPILIGGSSKLQAKLKAKKQVEERKKKSGQSPLQKKEEELKRLKEEEQILNEMRTLLHYKKTQLLLDHDRLASKAQEDEDTSTANNEERAGQMDFMIPSTSSQSVKDNRYF